MLNIIKTIRKYWLIVTFITVVIVPPSIGALMRYEKNAQLEENFFNTAEQLRTKKNYDGASAVYDFIIENQLDGYEVALSGKQIVMNEKNSYYNTIKDYVGGFVYGEIENTASLVGCVSGDVFVWGDFRDFVKNSYRYCTGGEVDKINYLLSSIGLATTILPEVDVGFSVCKSMAKFMTAGVRKFLLEMLELAKQTKKFDRLYEFMGVIGKVYKKIGSGVIDVLQMAKDSDQLMMIANVIEKHGRSAYSFILVGGEEAYKFLTKYGDDIFAYTAANGKKALAFCLKYPKIGARFVKIGKVLLWDNFAITMMAISELLALIPLTHTVMICFLIWLWLSFGDLLSLAFGPKENRPEKI